MQLNKVDYVIVMGNRICFPIGVISYILSGDFNFLVGGLLSMIVGFIDGPMTLKKS